MRRALGLGLLFCLVLGCQLPPERGVPLRPLPEAPGGPLPLPYPELLTRARYQATAATEAFYVNRWSDLEEIAKGLEQTARFLVKAEEVPANLKPKLPAVAADLAKEARSLGEAARAQKVEDVNNVLQRLHLKIRELRIDG
jgi:hypothetical protein